MNNIFMKMQQPQELALKPPVLRLGFRLFFLGATAFAVLSMLIWSGIYIFHWDVSVAYFSPLDWHAHEMIYGYGMAVIAGFLLTAVRNWTGINTLSGYPLLGLFMIWVLARLLPFAGDSVSLLVLALVDNLFIMALMASVLLPIIKARLWRNLAITGKLLLLLVGNGVFYLGLAGNLDEGVRYGLYSGLYLILALIFTIGRRVIPFFIERGVGYPVRLKNARWIDIGSIIFFVAFWVADLLDPYSMVTALLALLLFIIHTIRLAGWYTSGIWRKPLLWILYLGYTAIILGFMLKFISIIGIIPFYLAVHAFAVGGIGMMTLGMMARVSLGHTGRSIHELPVALPWIFAISVVTLLVRVIGPILIPEYYQIWILVSQILWMLAFGAFFYVYLPILSQPRMDGQNG